MRTINTQQRYSRPARQLFHGVIVAFAVCSIVFMAGAPLAFATTSYWTFPPTFYKTYTLSSGFGANGVVLNAYGTLMYAMTNYSGGNYRVEEYVLTTPWDVSTATYLKAQNLGAFSTPKLDYLSEDGTKMYIAEGGAWSLYKYTLSTPWDVATMSRTQTDAPCGSNYVYGATFALGGTHYATYCGDGTTRSYTLLTAWDMSSGSATKSVDFGAGKRPALLAWSPDGTAMLGDVQNYSSTTDYLAQYSCSTGYDISTCSLTATDTYDYSTTYGQGDNYDGLWASLDANYIILVTHANPTHVVQFSIGTGTTWTYTGTFPASGAYNFPSIPPASQSWIGTLLYPIGKFFSDILQYLFIPSSTEISYWTQLADLAKARAPFSYIAQTQTIFSGATASSSAFPTLTFNVKDFHPPSSTPAPYAIHASVSLMSTSLLNTYFNGTVKTLFQTLITVSLWLLFALHVYHTVLTLI